MLEYLTLAIIRKVTSQEYKGSNRAKLKGILVGAEAAILHVLNPLLRFVLANAFLSGCQGDTE